MQTSPQGIEFTERHEQVVLKAYRAPEGRWTIGAGLTAASGVVKPRAGMVITREEARRLMMKALAKYERRVAAAMPAAEQHEFDGAVSFDWNTGAVNRASWVKAWIKRDWPEVKRRLALWNKGGGRVLPGLTRRRAEEYDLIHHGIYRRSGYGRANGVRIVMVMAQDEAEAVRAAFVNLGYEWSEAGVRAFQGDHDLTVDGLVGRATLSTLQRRIDASRGAKNVATGGAIGGGTLAMPDTLPVEVPWLCLALLGLGAIYLAYHYRDVVAAKIHRRAPRLAAKLRSF